jgi:hypothetical protein
MQMATGGSAISGSAGKLVAQLHVLAQRECQVPEASGS